MNKFWGRSVFLGIVAFSIVLAVSLVFKPFYEKKSTRNEYRRVVTSQERGEISGKNSDVISWAQEIHEAERLRKAEEARKAEREHALQALSMPFDPRSCGSWEDVVRYAENYNEFSRLVKKYEVSHNPELAAFAKTLKQNLVSHQVKTFPILRKEFAKKLGQYLWQQNEFPLLNDVELNTGGDRNEYLYLTWAGFQINANIKYCQQAFQENFNLLRITQVRYCGFYKFKYEYAFNVFIGRDSDI